MSSKEEWETPDSIFNYLNLKYNFTIDAAANEVNHKLERYISEKQNAFNVILNDEIIWCNPPYTSISKWIDLFISWSINNTVVALLPSSTDTKWFYKAYKCGAGITLLSGRINFVGSTTSNPLGSCIMVFNNNKTLKNIKIWDWKQDINE